jgi:hypothetical protein
MSFKRLLFVSTAAIALIAPAADASAQYHYFGRQNVDRYQRPASAMARAVRAPNPAVLAARTPATVVSKPTGKPATTAPPSPLTEEQLAAKAAVDELISRDPALAAAREQPDPRLAQAAAARHKAEEQRLAALRAKEDAAASKRKDSNGKIKAREDAKAAAIKTRRDAQAKSTASKTPAKKSSPESNKVAAAAPIAAAQPLRRMPTP